MFVLFQRYGKIGVAIGSDQWYPEVARSLVVQGAELLLYPSAMGSNQYDPNFDPRDQWQRVMQVMRRPTWCPLFAPTAWAVRWWTVFRSHSSAPRSSQARPAKWCAMCCYTRV